MTTYVPVRKNDANGAILYISLSPQIPTGIFQANPTLATGDVKISIDGGAFANLGTLPAVTPAGGKSVKVTLSQAETNGDNLALLFSDAAGAEWCDLFVNIQTTARNIDDLAYPATSGRSLNVSAGGEVILASAYDFAKGTAAMTESYAANTVAPTPVQALYAIHQMLQDFSISGTTYTVLKLDHATTAFLGTLDSATTPTSLTRT